MGRLQYKKRHKRGGHLNMRRKGQYGLLPSMQRNAYQGGVRGGEGGNDGRCQRDRKMDKKRHIYRSKTCGVIRCLTDCTLLSE